MNPRRPYLLRALYQWIIDSDEVPYVLVDASVEEVQVPLEFVQDGQIVLNVGPNAVRDLSMQNDFVMFSSRFNGAAMEVILPMASIRAIYCKDSGEGMVFPDEDYPTVTSSGVIGASPVSSVTVDERADASKSPAASKPTASKPVSVKPDAGDDNKPDKPGGGKPGLRLV